MDGLRGLRLRLRALLRKAATERDLDDEIRLHVDLETEKNAALGMTRETARREAMRAFGGIEVAKEAHRGVVRCRPANAAGLRTATGRLSYY